MKLSLHLDFGVEFFFTHSRKKNFEENESNLAAQTKLGPKVSLQ